jgi:excisionase family DNA binding protein
VKLACAEVQHAMRHHTLPEVAVSAPEQPSSELHELLTVDDVAALPRVSKSWVYEHTRARMIPHAERLPHVRIGKYVRFDARAVRAYLARKAS